MIVCLHSVNYDNSPITITPETLEFFIKTALKFGYIFTTDLSIYEPKKNVVLTFDDGYKDNIKYALPILEKFNVNAICFIISNAINQVNFWDKDKEFYPKKSIMNKTDIQLWLKCGNKIGNHTLNHYDLTSLHIDEVLTEVEDCKLFLEEIFKTQIDYFCPPYGKTNTNINEIIQNTNHSYNLYPPTRYILDNSKVHFFSKNNIFIEFSKSKNLLWYIFFKIAYIVSKYFFKIAALMVSFFVIFFPRNNSCINNCKLLNFKITLSSYWENRTPTIDEKEIVSYLNNSPYSKIVSTMLHIGTGISYPAQYIKKYRSIDSFTICRGELEHALQLNNTNYNVFLKDKHEKNCFICWNKKYDIIIDNNIRSFCCCEEAFDYLFNNYYYLLNNGGIIVTHKDGMKWSTQLKPKFCFKSFKWVLKEKGSNPLGSFTLTTAEEKAKEFNMEFIVDNNIVVFKKS